MRKKVIVYGALVVAGLVVAGFIFSKTGDQKGETLVVHPGDFLQQVSVSGKIVAAESSNLSFKQSGRLAQIAVTAGQTVTRGQLLMALENNNEVRAVSSAALALAAAKLELERLTSPVNKKVEEGKLEKAYEDGLSEATSVYGNLFSILDELDRIFFNQNFSSDTRENNIEYYVGIADFYNPELKKVPANLLSAYTKLIKDYDPAFAAYQVARRDGDQELAIRLTAQLVSDTLNVIKTGRDVVQFFYDRSVANHWESTKQDLVNSQLKSLAADFTTVNDHWLKLLDVSNVIQMQKNALTVGDLDLRAQELEIGRLTNAWQEAKDRLADTSLRAPFNGVVTDIRPALGESAAAEAPVLSLISAHNLEIESYVPEIKIPLIKVGNPAEVSLDAYGPDVLFAAKVIALDPAETVRDGVATYLIKLQVENQDDRIKPGMTASLLITTEKKLNTIAVPQGIVMHQDGQKFVQVQVGKNIVNRQIETGLVSALGQVEVVSGLKDGDVVWLEPARK